MPEAAQDARGADVNGDEAERATDDVEAHVVDAHHATAVDVDDLLVHEVALEQDLVGPLRNLLMSSVEVLQARASRRRRDSTDDQGRKIWRASVLITRPVTGG